MSDSLQVGPDGLEDAILDLFGRASRTLDVMAYQVERESLIAALTGSARRGVRVRVSMDRRQVGNAEAHRRLGAAGVTVAHAPERFPHAHAKVAVVDGERALVMSGNLNDYSMETERNYALLLDDPGEVADLARLFDADVRGEEFVPFAPRLVVSPNGRARVEAHIRSARRQLDLALMFLNDDAVVAALCEQRAAGVPVRVLLADPDWIEPNLDTARRLTSAGIPVRFLETLELHAKLVIADGRALIGSHNLSPTSLDQNREVGLIVGGVSAGHAAAAFRLDWLEARPPEGKPGCKFE